MKCHDCGKDIPEDEAYVDKGKQLCEDCFIKVGLYPRGHTGSYRDKICGDKRRLTIWWADKI